MNKIIVKNQRLKWLFGGLGFHNSEATMTALMNDSFKNERVLKTFNEISPTFSRVFAGYSNWTKEAMDSFADFYDATFRKAGTLLYLVPGRMPHITDDFNMEEYCEKVAVNLEYLIKVRKCTKIRYYCVTNELSVGNTYAFLASDLPLLKKLHEYLYKAFRRHELDIGLLATDCSGTENFGQIDWARKNMDEVTECYCAHLYSEYLPGDLGAYDYYINSFTPPVLTAHSAEKRFVLGEFGLAQVKRFEKYPMRNDVSVAVDNPEMEKLWAIAICEMAMAAINSGCFSAAFWTLFDYPDPFIRENGDTPEEKARYDAARFSGHGLDVRYNKHGIIRWSDIEDDYSSRAALYSVGYMAKFFKKGSRVLECDWQDEFIRCCGVANEDGSVSVAIINWDDNEKKNILETEKCINKPMRRYEYSADNVPFNKFNDLQPFADVVDMSGQRVEITLKPKSVTFLTTDYLDRTPSKIKNIVVKNDTLCWDECKDSEHCYYRVFASNKKDFEPTLENQIASTIATSLKVENKNLFYKVLSVDKFGNV